MLASAGALAATIPTTTTTTTTATTARSIERQRPVAPWPPPGGKLRVIIDADAANEIDDQYALALALGRPDRIGLEGIVAAHFGDSGGSKGIDRSYAEIERVLAKAGMSGKVTVKRGADPIVHAVVR